MRRTAATIVFLTTVILIHLGVHGYLWLRLVADPALSPPWTFVASAVLAALFVGLPLFMALVNATRPRLSRLLGYPIYLWMALAFLLFMLLLAGDLVQLVVWIVQRVAGQEPWSADAPRRLLVARVVAGGSLAVALSAVLWGLRNAVRTERVRRLELRLPGLPAALEGFTIAQLTDLHLSARRGQRWLAGVVARTNALRPDLVAVTGDLVDGTVAALRPVAAPLADLRARAGVYVVTGNHDYYSGVEAWIAELERLGLRVLRNERVSVPPGADASESFDLAGIDDPTGRGFEGHGPDLSGALQGRDPARALVLLAHQPSAFIEAAARGVGLQLSGHTHGGQIWPFHLFVRLQQPWLKGLIRRGAAQLYISEGTGYWGMPVRLASRAEIALITLRS